MLNKQKIEAMEPGSIERDGQTRGLAIRAGKDGSRTWIWFGRVNTTQHKNKLGCWPEMTLDKARDEAARINDAIRAGLSPFAAPAREVDNTVGGLIAEFVERYASPDSAAGLSARTIADYRAKLDRDVPAEWRLRPVSSITREDVERLSKAIRAKSGRKERKDGHTASAGGVCAANGLMRVLRLMFNKAKDWNRLQGDNRCARVKLYDEPKPGRFLTDAEYARLGAALLRLKPLYPAWVGYFLATMTLGTRYNELLGARWEWVDLDARLLRFPVTKNGKAHALSLPEVLCDVLRELPSYGASEWLFPSEASATGHLVNAHKAWKLILKDAKITGRVRIHDLRHSFASLLLRRGVGLQVVKEALNHSSIAITSDLYGHLDQATKAAAIESVAAITLASPAKPSVRPAKQTRHRSASAVTVAKPQPQDAAA